MKPIVIFGSGKIAEVLLYFFRHHSDFEVAALTVDRDYLPSERLHDLPVVAFDELPSRYPPSQFDMFVALGYQDMNSLREEKFNAAREAGYRLVSYVHPDAGLPTDCSFGENCFFMNQVQVHPCVRFGDNVFVWSGAIVGHHSVVGDNCWLTSGANVAGVVSMGKNCFLAINATIAHGVTLGAECFVGANALVVKSAEAGKAFLVEDTKPFRLTSRQFLRMSRFADL
ncbi:MAG: acetyltransferase [Burkholderiales bacterium]